MKKLAAFILTLAVFPLLTGCVERTVYVQRPPVVVAQPGYAVVAQPPPAPPREVAVPAPGPAYVWVPGYWAWQGRWIWVEGRWVVRPYPRAAWAPGYWAHRPQGYIWIGGHWH